MPLSFPNTGQSALIVGRNPGPRPTPSSARPAGCGYSIGERWVQGDPRRPGVCPTISAEFLLVIPCSGIPEGAEILDGAFVTLRLGIAADCLAVGTQQQVGVHQAFRALG
jgi:hypothetical protein